MSSDLTAAGASALRDRRPASRPPVGRSEAVWPFLAIAVAMPALKSVLGIDGGAIFQIIAAEELGLDATAIVTAFAMGVLSVPGQLLAARLPLWRARRHLQIFVVTVAVQCAVLAALVGIRAVDERLAVVALGVTVVAEICLSVLYAPAWQPLVRHTLDTKRRQAVN